MNSELTKPRPTHTWVWGYGVWSGWLLLFLVLELASKDVFGLAPWPSLSATVWHAIHTYPLVGYALFGFLFGLVAHFFLERNLAWCVLYGIVVSVGAHLLDSRLP